MSEKTQTSRLTVGPAPHLRNKGNTTQLMKFLSIVLLLPTFGGIYYFGLNALLIVLTSVITCILVEYVAKRLRQQEYKLDYSAVVTGILFALILPPTVPLWMVVLGAAIAIGIVKEAFGGLGYNIFNPALAGRAFLAICFALTMTTWVAPIRNPLGVDTVTTATPLSESFELVGSQSQLYMDMLLGNIGGCIGETSALLILIAGLILMFTGIIKWHIPVIYIGTVGLLTLLLGQDPLFHILAGGLFLGAFFMATDYVTIPMTRKGQMIFAFCAGLIVVIIRLYGNMPEGVAFSILLMNGFTPLIDRYVRPKPYGYVPPEKKGGFLKSEKLKEAEECKVKSKETQKKKPASKQTGGKKK